MAFRARRQCDGKHCEGAAGALRSGTYHTRKTKRTAHQLLRVRAGEASVP